MTDDYKNDGGILIPGFMKTKPIKCTNPIPLSILQCMTNKLFYQRILNINLFS